MGAAPVREVGADRVEADLELLGDVTSLDTSGTQLVDEPDLVVGQLGSVVVFADNVAAVVDAEGACSFLQLPTFPSYPPISKTFPEPFLRTAHTFNQFSRKSGKVGRCVKNQRLSASNLIFRGGSKVGSFHANTSSRAANVHHFAFPPFNQPSWRSYPSRVRIFAIRISSPLVC